VPERCKECDRLWREHSEVSQRSFRLEERLRHAKLCQDNDLANALAEKLVYVAGDATRTRRALEDPGKGAPPHKRSWWAPNWVIDVVSGSA
jgi:hypothetical protein